MQWASVGHGRCRALQRTERDLHRDRAASAVRGAPTRASHALPSSPSSLFPTLRSGRPSGTADAVPCRGQRGIYTGIARHLPCEARPRAPATHYLLLPPPYSLLYAVGVRRARQMPCLAEDREGFTQGSRGICRARRAHARQPRTSPSILLPIPYSTDAHCIVSTHSPLLPPPYSLLFLYSYCVEDCEECDPHVGEDSFPEGCLSEA